MTDHNHEQDEVEDLDGLDIPVDTLGESENGYAIWRSQEPDGEASYHIDLDIVTLHFFQEEWDEFVGLIQKVSGKSASKTTPPPAGKKHKK